MAAATDRALLVRWGSCVGHPRPEVFFDAETPDEAIALCRGCPVIEECLEYGRATGAIAGVWGGVDFGNRKRRRCRGCREKFAGWELWRGRCADCRLSVEEVQRLREEARLEAERRAVTELGKTVRVILGVDEIRIDPLGSERGGSE